MAHSGAPDTEEALRRSEARLRTVVEATPNAIILVNSSGIIEMVNAQTERLFGYTREELLGQPMEMLVPQRFRHHHPGLRSSFFTSPQARPMGKGRDLYALRKDGSEFPVEIGLNPIETEQGSMVLSAIVDLSARKQMEENLRSITRKLEAENEQRRLAERELERSREDFRYLFQRNPLPMWVYDTQTYQFLEVNVAAVNRYGYTREEFLNMSIFDIRSPESAEQLRQTLQTTPENSYEESYDWKHLTKDGKVIQTDIFSHAIHFEGRSARLVVSIDVTKRNAAEALLRQSQKMEAVGQLTGGVAHDFNNLLTIILGNLEMIADACGDNPAIQEMVQDSLGSVARGASLTQRLLAFSRQQSLEPKVVDVVQLVANMTELMRRSLGETIDIRLNLPATLWKARIDPSQLENALLNLAVNARDAMPRGGRLTIEGQNITLDNSLSDGGDIAPGDYVMLAISDTGTGIPRELLDRVLEPFFTTKPVGKGSGLGLSMVYGFVKQSGGHVKIYSELNHGTTIKLLLPRTSSRGEAVETGAPQQDMPRSTRGETILLVEDDANIRKLVQRILNTLGYQTQAAEDGPSALATLAEIPHLDLLFSDVVLPGGMSGVELAEQAKRRHTGLKVLLMSGYTRNALKEVSENDEIHLISKPFRKEDLARVIYSLLNESAEKRPA